MPMTSLLRPAAVLLTLLLAAQPSAAAPCEHCDCAKGAAPQEAAGPLEVPVGSSPVHGDPSAPVTVVAFVDFECPFCTRVSHTLTALEERYPGKVRVVVKHHPLPFHQNARSAARAAEAAHQQGRFWQFYEAVFARKGALDEDALSRAAAEAGLDEKQWRARREAPETEERVRQDEELARQVGASGTPTVFINGQRITGAQPLQEFAQLVDAQLKRDAAR